MPSNNKLTDDETVAIIKVCNEPRFASLPPTQIVPTLLDEKVSIMLESTFIVYCTPANQLKPQDATLRPELQCAPGNHLSPCNMPAVLLGHHIPAKSLYAVSSTIYI